MSIQGERLWVMKGVHNLEPGGEACVDVDNNLKFDKPLPLEASCAPEALGRAGPGLPWRRAMAANRCCEGANGLFVLPLNHDDCLLVLTLHFC